ncbi:10187_t:CDS:2 [Funneliformis mosseae]|uniref:rRNA biogenesis protein RRP36 n=1 Tax=Funneliformis mosseae TaxID=27381 RepID=A0A9N9FCG7_FUNMO|nr:10187_t:CDS:2 [Funneliformis mosseae]
MKKGKKVKEPIRKSISPIENDEVSSVEEEENESLQEETEEDTEEETEDTGEDTEVTITSKKPVSRFRQIVEVSKSVKLRRDPRFDSLSGKFNEDLFEKSYSFLDDYKKSEIELVTNQMKKESDIKEKSKLQLLLNKLKSKISHEHNLKRKKELKRERKKNESELVAQGKNPYYYKKSDEKNLELLDKFDKLQKSDPKVLEKVIEKRRKKNASKEHKRVPFKRRKVT